MELFCKLPRSRSMLCVCSFFRKNKPIPTTPSMAAFSARHVLRLLRPPHSLHARQGRFFSSHGWWTFRINDGDLSFLEMDLDVVGTWVAKSLWWKSVVVSLVICFFPLSFSLFLTGRWQHQIPSKSIKRGVRFIPEYVRVQEHAILEPNPTSADTVNIPWTTVIWHDWSQLVQDFVQPLMLHLPSSSKNDLLMSIESQDSNYIPFPKTNSKVLKIGPLPQKVSGIYSQVRTLCFRVWIGKTLPPFLSQ